MVKIYSQGEIDKIAYSGKILARVFKELKKEIKIGATLEDLDKLAFDLVKEFGADPAFLAYKPGGADHPYPASICASVNDVVVHGIPNKYKIQDGDVITIDFGVRFDGYYSDSAFTMVVGKSNKEKDNLLNATKIALDEAIKYCKPGRYLGDIGWAIETVANKYKVAVIEGLTGHGVGKNLHEPPTVFNYGDRGKGLILKPGMVLAIEPMFSTGSGDIIQKKDESWMTKDGSLSAQFEHTIAITEKGNRILTQ